MSESLQIQIHPLVVLNVADHYTRAKYRLEAGQSAFRVIGLIFGRQEGRVLEIENTLELKFDQVNANDPLVTDIKLDMEFA